jgi:hypothetical protein
VQREALRNRGEAGLHPLLERIMRIHVTEEARHLSFARHWLKRRVPELDPVRKLILAFGAPMILGEMGGLMMKPAKEIIEEFQIPRSVVREAYDDNPEWNESAANAMRKVRVLCRELGLITPLTRPLWKAKKIWAEDA